MKTKTFAAATAVAAVIVALSLDPPHQESQAFTTVTVAWHVPDYEQVSGVHGYAIYLGTDPANLTTRVNAGVPMRYIYSEEHGFEYKFVIPNLVVGDTLHSDLTAYSHIRWYIGEELFEGVQESEHSEMISFTPVANPPPTVDTSVMDVVVDGTSDGSTWDIMAIFEDLDSSPYKFFKLFYGPPAAGPVGVKDIALHGSNDLVEWEQMIIIKAASTAYEDFRLRVVKPGTHDGEELMRIY